MPKRQANIMVAIPVKKGSLGASASTTSTSASSSTAGQSPAGYSTPATTATTTPKNELESSTRASRRVNATARALELRNSSLGLNSRKRPANAPSSRPSTIDDEKLAAALQAEEYNARPTAKKQKTTRGSKGKPVIPDSESDAEPEPEPDSDSEEWFSTNEEAIKNTPKKSSRRTPRDYRAVSPSDSDLNSVVGMVTDSMDSSQLSDISSIADSEESDDLVPNGRYRRLERFIGASKPTRVSSFSFHSKVSGLY